MRILPPRGVHPSGGPYGPPPPGGGNRPRRRRLRPLVLAWIIGGIIAASAAAGFAATAFKGNAPTPAQSQAALTTSPTASASGEGGGPNLSASVRLPERALLGERFGLPGHNSAGERVSVPFRAHIPLAEPVAVDVQLDVYLRVSVDVYLDVYLRVSVVGIDVGIRVGEHILLVGVPAAIDARFHVGQHIPVSIGTRFHVAARTHAGQLASGAPHRRSWPSRSRYPAPARQGQART